MASSENQAFDDQALTRYLLGGLSAEEAERVDELSIADEEFSWRLNGLENDLVDAYVRGELAGKDLERFRSFYLSSAGRRRKVDFARGLLQLEQRAAMQTTEAGRARALYGSRPRLFSGWHSFFGWGFAGAAFVLLGLAIYLSLANFRLQRQLTEARQDRAAIEQRDRELEQQIRERKWPDAEARNQLERLRKSQANVNQLRTVSLLLPPPMRGAGRISTISFHPGTDLFVVLLLLTESNEFPAYCAALKDPRSGQVLWRSQKVEAASLNDKQAVSISFPATLLKQQNYIVELAGVRGGGPAVVADYAFRVVLQ